MTPQKFWMVWVACDTPTTNFRHPSYELARGEAERLARQNVGRKVYVLEAVDYRFADQLPITKIKL